MAYITALHAADADKVAAVASEMASLGSPTIRAVETCNGLLALEGVHRLAAAAQTGTPVTLDILDADTIDLDTLDWDDNGWFDDRRRAPLAEVIERMSTPPMGTSYRLDGGVPVAA